MVTTTRYDRRQSSTPPPHLLEKLRKSREDAEGVTMREINCPYCDFLVDVVGSDVRSGHKMIHCRKCKRDYLISYAHFRTQRPYKYRNLLKTLRYEKRRQIR